MFTTIIVSRPLRPRWGMRSPSPLILRRRFLFPRRPLRLLGLRCSRRHAGAYSLIPRFRGLSSPTDTNAPVFLTHVMLLLSLIAVNRERILRTRSTPTERALVAFARFARTMTGSEKNHLKGHGPPFTSPALGVAWTPSQDVSRWIIPAKRCPPGGMRKRNA